MVKQCSVTYEEIVSWENLCEAWWEFVRGKRGNYDVQCFMLGLSDELVALHDDLVAMRYVHGRYEHFRINDPKPRDIHKAAVRDRLVHHAIHRKVYSFFAQQFIADSFSCRECKGLHAALSRFTRFANRVSENGATTCWVLKCDIRKFFASIDHGILMSMLQEYFIDNRVTNLLEGIVTSFSTNSGKGNPLGNLTSQLFANIYLHPFDHFVKHQMKMKYYVRYADDFVFLSHERHELESALSDIERFLRDRLKLALHPKKIVLQTLVSGVDFLGWIHFGSHRIPRTKTKQRMLKRNRNDNSYAVFQSHLGLLGHGNTFNLASRLEGDHWFWHGYGI